jgi:hypothetical protein
MASVKTSKEQPTKKHKLNSSEVNVDTVDNLLADIESIEGFEKREELLQLLDGNWKEKSVFKFSQNPSDCP